MDVRKLLKRVLRFFWPTPAQIWDLNARAMRIEGYTEDDIINYYGPRPEGDEE